MFEEDMKLLGQKQRALLLMAQQETWASTYLYHFLLSQVLQRMMQIGPKEMSEHKVACVLYLTVLYCTLYYIVYCIIEKKSWAWGTYISYSE